LIVTQLDYDLASLALPSMCVLFQVEVLKIARRESSHLLSHGVRKLDYPKVIGSIPIWLTTAFLEAL